jgi:hypothetical protein
MLLCLVSTVFRQGAQSGVGVGRSRQVLVLGELAQCAQVAGVGEWSWTAFL